ncbi:MAG: type II toxin-antitoxin system antitoxin [Melioribacteraceae bacterium]
MAEKKKFLLRIDDKTYSALEKWAADEFRSINSQIEFLLKDLLKKNGRLKESNGEQDSKDSKPE